MHMYVNLCVSLLVFKDLQERILFSYITQSYNMLHENTNIFSIKKHKLYFKLQMLIYYINMADLKCFLYVYVERMIYEVEERIN